MCTSIWQGAIGGLLGTVYVITRWMDDADNVGNTAYVVRVSIPKGPITYINAV